MPLSPTESAQVADLDKKLRERGRRDFLLVFLLAISLILSAGALVFGLVRANRQADSAQTKVRINERRVVQLQRKVLPIQRVLLRRDVLREGPRGLTGGRGALGRRGARGPLGLSQIGPSGLPGAPSIVPGPKGDTGADSTVPGPPGDDSTVPGPQGEQGATGATGPAPQSFTFTFLATTYVCTDADQDGAYECAPSP